MLKGQSENLVFQKGFSLYRLVFWLMAGVLVLAMIVIWQLAEKRAENSPTEEREASFLSYPLDNYQILTPLQQVTPDEVQAILQPYLGQSFWDLPLMEIQSKLIRLDWVVNAKVSRSWPNLLSVVLTEQKPIARWGENGLINQAGEVFYPKSLEGFYDLVRLEGDLQYTRQVVRRYVKIQQALKAQKLVVERLRYGNDQVWEVGLFDGPKIILSDGSWKEELERFLLAYPKLEASLRNSATRYDLRYSNGFAISQK